MLTPEQANLLITEGLLSWQRGTVSVDTRMISFLEYLICVETLVRKAIDNGKLQAPWRTSSERYRYAEEAAGVLRLALQHHGGSEFNTFQLRRALHSQQADRRAELNQEDFMRKECADVFKRMFDAATTDQPIPVDDWKMLKSCLERLGVRFS